MGLLGYTFRTFNRLRHGKGFGVHSPFAYMFIREVLRLPDKYAYYSYHELEYWHEVAVDEKLGEPLPLKYLKMIFRIGNYFRSSRILLLGEYDTLLAVAAASVSPDTKVCVWDAAGKIKLDPLKNRSERFRQIRGDVDLHTALSSLADGYGRPTVIINGDSEEIESAVLSDNISRLEPVFIVVRLKQNRRIWNRLMQNYSDSGMSFANPHVAVMVPDQRLPRQHFNLWI